MLLGAGVTNSKVCIKRIEQKSVVQHNLASLKENAKVMMMMMMMKLILIIHLSLLCLAGPAEGRRRRHRRQEEHLPLPHTGLCAQLHLDQSQVWVSKRLEGRLSHFANSRADIRWNCLKPDQVINRCVN